MSTDRAEHESPEVETQFDPRHPLIFQRGYDPEAAAGGAGAAGAANSADTSRSWRARRAAASAPATATASVPVFPSHDQTALPNTSERGQHPGAVHTHPVQPDDAAAPPEVDYIPDPARNPFVIALWILGSVLIVAGISFSWWATSHNNYSYEGSEVPIEVILQQLSWSLSPTMVTVGGLTLVGMTFWRAIKWMPSASRVQMNDVGRFNE